MTIFLQFWLVITCPTPSSPSNGHLVDATGRYLLGDYVQYACNHRHTMKGQAVTTCLKNGMWSNPPPKCLFLMQIQK